MAKYECRICGYVFDEQQAGESFDNVYSCPICDADKEGFKLIDGDEADTDSKIDDSTSEDDDDFFFEEADGTIEKSGDVVSESENSTADNAVEKSESTDDASNADAEKEEIPESTSAFNSFADFLKSKEENKDEYKPSETKDFIDEVLESSDSLMTEEKEEEKAEETAEPAAQEAAEEKVEEPVVEEKEEPVEEKKEETPIIEFDNIFTKMDPVKEEDKVEETVEEKTEETTESVVEEKTEEPVEETTEFSFEEATEEKVEENVEPAVEEVKEEVTETAEEASEEAKEEAPTEFVIEKRQEFWKKEDDTVKEETEEEKSPVILNRMGSVEKVIGEGADDTEAPRESEYRREEDNDMIQTFYTGAPVKTEEQIKAEEEAKNKENQDFVPLWSGNGMGTVQKVVGEPKKEETPDDSEELIFEEENIDVKADEAKTEPEVTESAPDEDGVVYLNFGNEEKEEAEDTTKVVEDAVNEDASTEEDFFISEEDVQDENSVSYFVEEENDIKPEEPAAEETAETPAEEETAETPAEEATEAVEETVETAEDTVETETTEETTETATEETVEAAEAIDERDYICLDEDADVVDGKPVAYSMLKADMKYTVLYDLAAKKIFDDYPLRDANVSNGLENIILLPAQCNPLPLKRSATVETKTMIGALTDCPVEVLQPFCFSKLFLWGEHIPNNPRPETYANQALVLVKGEDGHIPNLSSKEELREEVAIAKERFNHTPVGIDLVAGRIEADLEACVYAKLDFVILNDVSSRILPYALRRARNYLNRVNSKLEILVCVEALKDAQELAKILALGANFVLVERGFDLDMANKMTEALKEICRSTGHNNVHDLSLDDICTIDTDLAMYTDIRHV